MADVPGTSRVTFQPFTRAELPRLATWLEAPHVARWWPREDNSLAALDEHYGPAIDGTDPAHLFLILANDVPVGFCEAYLHADNPEWDRTIALPNVAGIDYLIGAPERCGRGLGTAVISSFCHLVFDLYPQIGGIASVPQAENTPSRRVLEKNGFRLMDVRLVESDDPGDSGPAAIYYLER
jgi:aminoglycoside 6'-N-acetyltransferase